MESEESENETEDDFAISLDDDDDDDDENTRNIQFVVGDVTHPQSTRNNDAIIVHCVGEKSDTRLYV